MNEKEAYKNGVLANYEELEIELMALIILTCGELQNINTLNSVQFYMLKSKLGREVYKKALKEINKTNTQRKQSVKDLFDKQVINTEKQYKDYQVSKEQKKIIKENIKLTNDSLNKLAKDLAKGTRNALIKTMGELYKQVVRGNQRFDLGYKNTVDKFFNDGITFKDKLGRNRSVEATVRQDLLYRINETNRGIYKEVGNKLNTTGVQINISPNCRDTHQVINGQKFTNKEWKEYEYLTHEYNCQHIAEPIFYDIEDNKYTQKEIDYANNRTVKYKGEKIPYYEATQKQRALERAIRNAKKNVVVAKKTNTNIEKAQSKLNNAQSKMREYIKETGLTRDYDREYYAGYNRAI